jgi:hypothetical protein
VCWCGEGGEIVDCGMLALICAKEGMVVAG